MSLETSLRSERLTLVPLALSDVDELWPFVSDPDLSRHMTWAPHTDRRETIGFVESTLDSLAAGTGYTWAIRRDGVLSGLIGLDGVVRQMRAWRRDVGEIGYWLGAAHRGQGLVQEAGRAVMAFGFGPLALHKITIGCLSENPASKRVIETLGFRFVGEQKDHCHRFERWWDHLSYEMTVDEYRAATRTGG
jgi:RimJ/RimL family protein N-acetyltransferase